jgi:hypothetical protein
MFYDTGCYGQVVLGDLPDHVRQRLAALPGDWLEYDAAIGAIVVRHIQPSAGPSLPTIAGELVRILSEIPEASREAIPGGDLFVHTERSAQLVRLRVGAGGAVGIEWAHPDYTAARPQPYTGAHLEMVEPRVQRLNGRVSFTTPEPEHAARKLETVADTYEGLYPEGELVVTADRARGSVAADIHDLNLDVLLLVETLQEVAAPGSLAGDIKVSSFAAVVPEQQLRFLFRDGMTWVQRPVLWREARDGQPAAAGAA